MNGTPSDEILHAFIDGELDVVESEAMMIRIREDGELARRVCALRNLQGMVRLAYLEPPPSTPHQVRAVSRRRLVRHCALGCAVLFAGWGGWLLRDLETRIAAAPQVLVSGDRLGGVSLAREPDPNRIVLHLDNADPGKMQTVLDEAERRLVEAERQGRSMALEVIANSHGVDLLRADISPHAARMAEMTRRHANLHWVACGQSLARFAAEGQSIVLLPATRTAPTAIGEIVSRLQDGWTYVRV